MDAELVDADVVDTVRVDTGPVETVPVVDLTSDPVVLGPQIDAICSQVGFFQIVGHGIDDEIADRAWGLAQEFFDLPLEQRMAVAPPPGHPYGYAPFAAESLGRSLGQPAPPDLKEAFGCGPVDRPTHRFHDADEQSVYAANLWPSALPELEVAWTTYYRAMLGLGGRLMSLFALALQLPPSYFDAMIDRSASAMRAINYPTSATPAVPGQLRAGAHTDYGTLTMLRQDTVGGLEVLDTRGNWVAVPSVPGAFVVNIGDLMARWTNDRWRSTLHRVVEPVEAGGARRQSMPFFHNANWDAAVTCLPSCLTPGTAAIHPPVLAGPHLMAKFRAALV